MTALALRWRKPGHTITTRWRGPDGRTTAAAEANPPRPIASLIGPPGPTGNPTVAGTAWGNLGARRVVKAAGDGTVRYVSPTDSDVESTIGLTVAAALAGEPVLAQFMGTMTDPDWNWEPGTVWLGDAGTLTQVQPPDGEAFLIGIVITPTSLLLQSRLLVDPAPAEAEPVIHTQASPSSEWIVNHSKGYPPLVDVLTPDGRCVEAGVLHASDDQVRIQFNAPASGRAILR